MHIVHRSFAAPNPPTKLLTPHDSGRPERHSEPAKKRLQPARKHFQPAKTPSSQTESNASHQRRTQEVRRRMHIEHPSFSAPQSLQQARRQAEEGSVGTPPQEKVPGRPRAQNDQSHGKIYQPDTNSRSPPRKRLFAKLPSVPKKEEIVCKTGASLLFF